LTGLKTARKLDDRSRQNYPITTEEGRYLIRDVQSGTAKWTKQGEKKRKKLLNFLADKCESNLDEKCVSIYGQKCSQKESENKLISNICHPSPPQESFGGACLNKLSDIEKSELKNKCFTRAALEPIAILYQELLKVTKLPSNQTYEDIFQLEPKSFVRSLRGRYHFVELSLEEQVNFFEHGLNQLELLRKTLDKVKNRQVFTKEKNNEIKELITLIKNILNNKEIFKRVSPKLAKIFPNEEITPYIVNTLAPLTFVYSKKTSDNPDIILQQSELKQIEVNLKMAKVVANTVSDLFHEVSKLAKPFLIDSLNKSEHHLKDLRYVDNFKNWQGYSKFFKQEDSLNLVRKTDFVALEQQYKRLKDSYGIDELKSQYKSFWKIQDENARLTETKNRFVKMGKADLKRLRDQLKYQKYIVQLRKIEAAGTMAKGLWFDAYRSYVIPGYERVTERSDSDHLLIDTLDFASIFDQFAWHNLAPGEYEDNQHEPDIQHLLSVEFVNEVQIELGKEQPFLKRIKQAKQNGNKQKFAQAKEVFQVYLDSISYISKIKGTNLISKLQEIDQQLCPKWVWENALSSKGEIAIDLVKEKVHE
jgi:hypothetical protein